MNILITGANGFVGRNLVATLKQGYDHKLILIDKENSKDELVEALLEADFIYHLAGINRPENDKEFFEGNSDLTKYIIDILIQNNKKTSVLMTSSIQAELDNSYGKSKKQAEETLINYAKTNGANIHIYRLPNVFGKWCRPNYNSAVATFCHNISRDKEVWISDPNREMTLVYIDDVVRNFIDTLHGKTNNNKYFTSVDVEYKVKLGRIVELLTEFKESRHNLRVPNMEEEFSKKLYSTYLSYLPENKFSYPLKMNADHRGSFTEFIKSSDRGQVSINISKPGITKGNHWHNTKNEKFLVVGGQGVIRFRKLECDEIIEYKVSGDKLEVVDIPVGYTHSIVNTGDIDLVTIMWVNEVFNPEVPDTYYLEV